MPQLILPKGYRSSLRLIETQEAIMLVKDVFQRHLAKNLNLSRVSAPMFVKKSSGLNDNLSGVEDPVSFDIDDGGRRTTVEIVHSLAKWKRYALKEYGFRTGSGLYADMNAIRANEIPDNTHSFYVDQWDWEKVIEKKDRTLDYLKTCVEQIYDAFRALDRKLCETYENYHSPLPDTITFVTAQELEDRYPDLTSEERERVCAKEHGAIFLMQIGKVLASGKKHDERAPDYDDWDLNGDIILWNPILDDALELSSMGIRVSPESLIRQLRASNAMERLKLEFHTLLAAGRLPYTIGGGIGQSRMCMYFLQKAHIGGVQSSVWPEPMRKSCELNGIRLL